MHHLHCEFGNGECGTMRAQLTHIVAFLNDNDVHPRTNYLSAFDCECVKKILGEFPSEIKSKKQNKACHTANDESIEEAAKAIIAVKHDKV